MQISCSHSAKTFDKLSPDNRRTIARVSPNIWAKHPISIRNFGETFGQLPAIPSGPQRTSNIRSRNTSAVGEFFLSFSHTLFPWLTRSCSDFTLVTKQDSSVTRHAFTQGHALQSLRLTYSVPRRGLQSNGIQISQCTQRSLKGTLTRVGQGRGVCGPLPVGWPSGGGGGGGGDHRSNRIISIRSISNKLIGPI